MTVSVGKKKGSKGESEQKNRAKNKSKSYCKVSFLINNGSNKSAYK